MAGEAGTALAAGHAANEFRENNRGVLLALAIVLLWLAGVAFFFAFEGVQNLQSAETTGSGLFKAMIGNLSSKAQAQEKQNAKGE
jgi:hypothetical protein